MNTESEAKIGAGGVAIASVDGSWGVPNLGGSKMSGEKVTQRGHIEAGRLGFHEGSGEALRPQSVHSSCHEGSANQRPVRLNEAQCSRHRHVADDLGTSSTCLRIPSTSLVQSRRPTMTLSTRGLSSPPSTFISGRPL